MTERFLPGLLVAVLLAAAFLLRIACIFSEFWLDEIWSYFVALKAVRPLDIILQRTFDNNHPLNTLFIWLLGRQHRWELYRLLSLASGTATVALMGLAALPAGRRAALATLVLGGGSCLLVLYSSEARGYAPAAFFALLSFLLVRTYIRHHGRAARLLLWATLPLGFLSHASFLFVHAGLIGWSVLAAARDYDSSASRARDLAALHGVPLLLTGFLAALHFQLQQVGGGPSAPVPHVLLEAMRLTLGLPDATLPAGVLACGALLVAGLEIRHLFRRGDAAWVLFAIALFAAPVLALSVLRPQFVYPRYFFLCAPWLLLLLGQGLGRLSRRGPAGALAAFLLLGAFAAGSAPRLLHLLREGRGHQLQALGAIAAQTPGNRIAIGSNDDFSSGMIIAFYAQYLAGKEVLYTKEAEINPGADVEWFIASPGEPEEPSASYVFANGHTYALVASYPYTGESGLSWYVYRRAGTPPPGPAVRPSGGGT